MDLAFILAAAEAVEHEKSEMPFFIFGSLLAIYAIVISVFGFKRPAFPETAAAARGVMSTGALLVVMAVGSAIYVAI